MLKGQFTLPIEIDLAATLLFSVTGALVALRRGYDVIGLLRDVLVRDEPLLFKPGQFYVLAAFAGCLLFPLLALYFKMEATTAALIAILTTFVFRLLAIQFNWVTPALGQKLIAKAPEQPT